MPVAVGRLLIATAEDSQRQLLIRHLSASGYSVEAVPDGTAALGRVQSTPYDLILADLQMPGAGGLEVLRAAKAANRFTEVILLTTASDSARAAATLREADAYGYLTKPISDVEVLRASVARALERRALRMDQERLTRELEQQTSLDLLTGALNRRAFFDLGEREFARAARHREPLTLIMLDLDHFQVVNDTHGQTVGDAVLARVAQICRRELRTEDLLGRYFADKFVCLLPETELTDAEIVAERIRTTLAASPLDLGDRVVPVQITSGVASRQDSDRSLDTVLRRAERLVRQGKERGRNRVYAER